MLTAIGTFSQLSNSLVSIPVTARVIRLWTISRGDREMLIFDTERSKMEVFISKHAKLRTQPEEGKTYIFKNYAISQYRADDTYRAAKNSFKMMFKWGTEIYEVADCGIPRYSFDLHTVDQIMSGVNETCYLIDFIGVLTNIIGITKKQKTRINFHLEDIEGRTIEVALFEDFAEKIKGLVNNVDINGVVLLLAGVQINKYRDVTLQQAYDKTALILSDDVPEVAQFRAKILQDRGDALPDMTALSNFTETTLEDQFMDESKIRGIDYFMNGPEVGDYITKAKIDCLQPSGPHIWFYYTCPYHSTAVSEKKEYPLGQINNDGVGMIEDISNVSGSSNLLSWKNEDGAIEKQSTSLMRLSDGNGNPKALSPSTKFLCKDCDDEVTHLVPRYKVQFCVSDKKGCASFVMWGRDVQDMINKPCHTMKVRQEQRNRLRDYPEELQNLKGQTYLFRVQVNKFNMDNKESAYSIKAMINDNKVIQKFDMLRSESSTSYGTLVDISSEVDSNLQDTPTEKRKSDEIADEQGCIALGDLGSEARSYPKKRAIKIEKVE